VVLFIGMSILLASTYVTLNSQERVERHGSVVRVGQPIVHLEENGAVAPVLEEKMKTPEVGSRVRSVVNTHKMPGRLKDKNLQGLKRWSICIYIFIIFLLLHYSSERKWIVIS